MLGEAFPPASLVGYGMLVTSVRTLKRLSTAANQTLAGTASSVEV